MVDERHCPQGFQNGRKPALISGLLRNSTEIATQFSGLEQCSQKAPGDEGWLKPRPACSGTPAGNDALDLPASFNVYSLHEYFLGERDGPQAPTG